MEIQTKIQYSRECIVKTHLIKFYLKAMTSFKTHFPLLQGFVSDINLHINKYGSNVVHPTHTCTSIYEYLISIEAPEHFLIQCSIQLQK